MSHRPNITRKKHRPSRDARSHVVMTEHHAGGGDVRRVMHDRMSPWREHHAEENGVRRVSLARLAFFASYARPAFRQA
jgi:hypothetical protein